MKEGNRIYDMPNLGCLLGTAYQTLSGRLAHTLARERLGITVPEYLILRALFTHDGMQQCEIGEMIGKDKGAICRGVKSLESKGFVRTVAVSHKCLRVYLSAKGMDIKPAVMKIAADKHSALVSLLTENELAALESALKKILFN